VGVLRLLQEGHFKGVADVRLRINFHEAITQQQTEAARAAVPEAVGALTEQVASGVAALTEAGQLGEAQVEQVGGLIEVFTGEAAAAADAFTTADPFIVSDLVSALQTAFDTLRSQAQGLLIPEVAESPEGEVTAVEEAADETAATEASPEGGELAEPSEQALPDMQAMLEQLAADFASALADFEQSLASTGALPPLDEPSGTGQAYAKFLQVYQSLYGTASIDELVGDSVDIEA